ncbi:tetratricopeptide repeat protein [Acinetobacter bereziniae]|uniref:tetratricopeptide repeat protein n=1 Tax=Acinetobacter bereziniae TaxID=106648 RepID=UPI00374E8AD5
MRTLQTSFLKSFFTFSLIISPLSFAENPLLTQAKILQTGSPTVLINTDKAIQLLQQASDQGDAEAYFLLAKYYSNSADYRFLPENNNLYKKLRLEAAQRGNFDAYLSLDLEAEVAEGFGISSDIKQNLLKIRPKILKLAEQGDTGAMRTLVYALDNDADGYSDEQCQWLFQAAQKGDTLKAGALIQNCPEKILKRLGAKTKQDYARAYKDSDLAYFKMLQQRSNQGDINAKIKLLDDYASDSYLSDKEIKQLENSILAHYEKQAAKGASDAYLMLALKKDTDKDKQDLYSKAALLNNHVALTELGSDYLLVNDEDQKDIHKGLDYLKKAAAQNDPEAINYLGVWYFNEENEDYDEVLAQKYFKQAAELGSVNAMDNLARIMDQPEDYRWAVLAYENGSSEEDTQSKALEAYQTGKGTTKDPVKARKLKTYIQMRAQFNNNLSGLMKSLNNDSEQAETESKNRKR